MTEEDLINLHKLAEQQKNRRAIKIKNRILKQTHDMKIAETLSPITKKLEEVAKSTKNSGEIIKEANSGNDKNQDIVPAEIDSEEDSFQSIIITLPNSKKLLF